MIIAYHHHHQSLLFKMIKINSNTITYHNHDHHYHEDHHGVCRGRAGCRRNSQGALFSDDPTPLILDDYDDYDDDDDDDDVPMVMT